MEQLPAEYIDHGLPLVFLSGLTQPGSVSSQTLGRQESGTRITAESSICGRERAQALSECLAAWDGTSQPWNSVALPGPTGALKYRFKATGRNYTLPARKAAPQAQSPTSEQIPIRQNNELHSPLSPLSPGSPVYPDGIMTPLWFAKHQSQVPCLVLAFFDFTSDGGQSQDEAIKADMIAAKNALIRSGFRTRFAAVLISDKSIVQMSELEDRFSSIRKATSSDAKTGLFFMPPMPSAGEVASFAQTILTTLQPGCIEYYRELTKHARRKKARSTTPISPTLPTHFTAQSLSPPGWNARYELKQAVFAEARQDMDVAERHYSQAIEDICNADGVFETMPSWSPRWNETRLLCDSIATRVLRCHLWNGMTTTAAQFWYEYRARIKSLIDRRGKGTHTYGWPAWECRWAQIMAQLIQLAELPMLDSRARPRNELPLDTSNYVAYCKPDRAFQGLEDIPPTLLLHHPGYWHRLAIRFAHARHASVISIPDEDRIAPGQSPASQVASRAQAYDTYLVPEPHEEYARVEKLGLVSSMQLGPMTEQATQEFANKGQQRMIQTLSLDLARALMQEQQFEAAYRVLQPLWESCTWRHERWHNLFKELISDLLKCAVAIKDQTTVLALLWEYISLPPLAQEKSVSVASTLEEVRGDEKAVLEYVDKERLSPLDITFAFDNADAYAGEESSCQITITNLSRSDAEAIHLAHVVVQFSDGQEVRISSNKVLAEETLSITRAQLQDGSGKAPLSLKPLQTSIVHFNVLFRESGPVDVQRITAVVDCEHYQVKHTIQNVSLLQAAVMYHGQKGAIQSHDARQEDTTAIQVLPKPPKVDIRLLKMQKQYFAGEEISLGLELFNREAYSVSGDVTLSATHVDGQAAASELFEADTQQTDEGIVDNLAAGATHTLDIFIKAPQATEQLEVAITFTYKLDSGSQSILIKTFETTISLAALLDVKWSFGPLLHPDPWPSYFDAKTLINNEPCGIPQRWQTSFAGRLLVPDIVTVHKTSLRLDRQVPDAVCQIHDDADFSRKHNKISSSFSLTTSKKAAEDRRPVQLQLACAVEWSRNDADDDEPKQTYLLPVPKIVLPTSEPRVLCTATNDPSSQADAIITYHLENPSTHFLTFLLTMSPSDDFAFTGLKYRTLSLVPMSKLAVSYHIMLHSSNNDTEEGRWIWPQLQVTDSYYQKTLRVQPAGADVKLDAKNGLGVFVKPAQATD